MKKITECLSVAATFITLFILPSCSKINENANGTISDNASFLSKAHDPQCRVTQIGIKGYYGNSDQYIVYYNAKGNPDSLIDNNPVGNIGNSRFFFRYDNSDRVSGYMWAETISSGMPWFAIVWHKYVYVKQHYIVDTTLTYAGDVRLPPPAAKDAAYYSISAYTLDGHDRIIKQWSIQEPNEPPHEPVLTNTFDYDHAGNKVLSNPDLTYDNTVNVYRTNKVWQFLYNDYSANNVVKSNSSYVKINNGSGLPLSLPNLTSYDIRLFDLYNTDLTTTFTYACPITKGPVDY